MSRISISIAAFCFTAKAVQLQGNKFSRSKRFHNDENQSSSAEDESTTKKTKKTKKKSPRNEKSYTEWFMQKKFDKDCQVINITV